LYSNLNIYAFNPVHYCKLCVHYCKPMGVWLEIGTKWRYKCNRLHIIAVHYCTLCVCIEFVIGECMYRVRDWRLGPNDATNAIDTKFAIMYRKCNRCIVYCICSVIWSQSPIAHPLVSFQGDVAKETSRTRWSIGIREWRNDTSNANGCTSIWMRSHMNVVPYECDPIWMWSHMSEDTTLQTQMALWGGYDP